MRGDEIRQKYLDFFKVREHAILPSALLLPENDPTTLFTGSGMQPLLRYFLGELHPLGKRVADSQKSFRSQDIEEVGDNRHTTFFEMLGNWSFGDYFKEEQIPWIFEFLVKELKLDPERLYFTCFSGNEGLKIPKDETSARIWQKLLIERGISADIQDFPEKNGMQKSARIFYYDERKNWWSRAGSPNNMPVGEPGGPDSEIFWDFGGHLKIHENSTWKEEPCHVNCNCGRFMEIGNNVFMEYVKAGGGFEKLPKPNVDFGGGLERLAAASNDDPDIFKIDLFKPLSQFLEERTGKRYSESEETIKAFRVILDHIRAAAFLIADGVIPLNTDQGYVLRRLIRRAAFKMFQFKVIDADWIKELVFRIALCYKEAYPELQNNKAKIAAEMAEEVKKFYATLEIGEKLFSKLAKKSLGKMKKTTVVKGKDAFLLFSTYGFPLELTKEIASSLEISVDEDGFREEMKKHQKVSKAGSERKFKGGLAGHSDIEIRYHTATHLLHQALRSVLGNHVLQKGSNITPERLRFDFTHFAKLTDEEKGKVETLVNQKIKEAISVFREEVPLSEARRLGAIGLFGEKYGEVVSLYRIGDEKSGVFSLEFCGGPHVTNTNEIGHFKIIKEEAVGSGIRRIKALVYS